MQIVFLCGFMGCGKSSVGKAAAEKSAVPFYDIDEIIESIEKKKISEIFRLKGEDYFRKIESTTIMTVVYGISQNKSGKTAVVALGGGAVTNPENAKFIGDTINNKDAILVFLDADFKTCYGRISEDASRPVAAGKSKEQLEELYYTRRRIYRTNSTHTITVKGDETVNILAERISLLIR